MFGVALWQALCAACVLAVLSGRLPIVMATAGLLANWCVLTAYASATGDQFNWQLNAGVDYAMVLSTMLPFRSRGSIILIASVGLAMVFHATFGLGEQTHDDHVRYWWEFHYLAWLQAAIVLLWGGGSTLERVLHWSNNRRRLFSMGSRGAFVRRVSIDPEG